ncbi:MAG: hypothetical protein RBR78_04270 [Flavobacteriaceae bacterium]|nr:hypothetical protein [Flavobacteriaceae bacterium]
MSLKQTLSIDKYSISTYCIVSDSLFIEDSVTYKLLDIMAMAR